jgi:hypothetical protein
MLAGVRQGRSRYVRLADPGVAQLIEDLSVSCGSVPQPVRSLRAATAAAALAKARTCYDHLAGRLGVQITDAMTIAGLIDQSAGFALTHAGLRWLADTLDIDIAVLGAARRPLARSCIDWTERRPHLGGAAGAALCAQFFARNWIRRPGTTRAVVVTPLGAEALAALDALHLTNVA